MPAPSDPHRILIQSLVAGRIAAGLSSTDMAKRTKWSPREVAAFEGRVDSSATLAELTQYAGAMGLAVNVSFDPTDDSVGTEDVVEKMDAFLKAARKGGAAGGRGE